MYFFQLSEMSSDWRADLLRAINSVLVSGLHALLTELQTVANLQSGGSIAIENLEERFINQVRRNWLILNFETDSKQ